MLSVCICVSSVLKTSGFSYVTLRSFSLKPIELEKINDRPKTTHQIYPGVCTWLFFLSRKVWILTLSSGYWKMFSPRYMCFCLVLLMVSHFQRLGKKKCSVLIKKCSVLSFAITTCQLSLLLCLFFAWSNITLMFC